MSVPPGPALLPFPRLGGVRPVAPNQDSVLMGVPRDESQVPLATSSQLEHTAPLTEPLPCTQVNAFVNALVVFLVFLAPMSERFKPLNDTVMMPLLLTMVMGGM